MRKHIDETDRVTPLVHTVRMVALDCIGTVGAIIAAIGATSGLGVFGQYEGVFLYIFQGFAVLTLAGLVFSYRRHRDPAPLVVGTLGCANLAYHFYLESSLPALYGGLLGLIAAALWNYVSTRRGRRPILESTLTCPNCGHKSDETMPTDACVFFHDCSGCGVRLKPKPGDCCVFCSYGSVPCPPIQTGESCCP